MSNNTAIRRLTQRRIFRRGLAVGALSLNMLAAQDSAPTAPLLPLNEAIQLALANNRSIRIAGFEVDKSKWQIAESKTNRMPSVSGSILGSQLLNELSFSYEKGAFGTYPGIGPIPSTDTKITTPRQLTAFV